ncbi:1,2-phenylacetyl-CoA epoxidase subunit PaaE [Spirilliplanes yamanashiensis]|uniref:Phenylacetic acid degradation protein n=1 Tax=Spirilliplanes yamanashiensis TaxID=42233 RepID=A0A8J3Y9C8_9ACTN|nr:1,2-phenylacetyl-CoA epoxidase subunit PaaE [Spirilliplanes yamanashiensis]MDP9815353.1 ring-1,2-phenylacetyl-CoA epoxidase subunit PaaE [Spirilliplanes yamanashiensis]GIJ03608.1 phenylacetic acid degradation protein [Spirilliplanes yamanashiensis]
MSVVVKRPVRRRPTFHPLTVAGLDRLTEEAVAITFAVPPPLRELFAFRPGQHVTVRLGDDVRRSYSICSPPGDGRTLRIGVKEVPGGAFSGHAVRALKAGDTIDVLPPLGNFTTDFDPGRARSYGAVVAGSGITPVLSLVAHGLAVEPASTFTVVYGNRHARTVMFAEELADLKDRYPARLQVVHVLSREPGEAPLLSGRIDADRMRRLLDTLLPPVDEWFLCGPYGMVTDVRAVLAERGAQRVHQELFFADDAPPPAPARPTTAQAGAEATVLLDGRATTVTVAPGERVLDAALRVRPELPFACKGGVCSTCRAKVTEGSVSMARNYALEPDEVAAGYVLTCQSTADTDRLVVDFDA